jgi:hypothetical protein
MPDAPTTKNIRVVTILSIRSSGFSRFFRLKAGPQTKSGTTNPAAHASAAAAAPV